MPSPWEEYKARSNSNWERENRNTPFRALASARMSEYRSPMEPTTTTVQVDPSVLAEQRNLSRQKQGERYRGLLSGPAAAFPNISDLQGGGPNETALRASQASLNAETGANPFKWTLQKVVAPTLQKWQQLTEWTAGAVSTPFSEELQIRRDMGMSPGERWRDIDLPTARIGKAKGEGFGMDVGVKGAVELLVDPVGWAMMAVPVGAIFRPLKFTSKAVGSGIGKVTGLSKMSKAGRARFARDVKRLDLDPRIVETRSELQKETQKRIINLYSGIENGTGHFKNGHYFGTVADSTTVVTQKDFINPLMNMDEMFSNKDTIGYVDGILSYINSKAKADSSLSGAFFRALDNPIQKWRPHIASLSSVEGRALYWHNQYKVATEFASRQMGNLVTEGFNATNFKSTEELFGAVVKSVEAMVLQKDIGGRKLKHMGEFAVITPKINKETTKVILRGKPDKYHKNPMVDFFDDIEKVGKLSGEGIDPRLTLSLAPNGTVTVGTTQGFSNVTLKLNLGSVMKNSNSEDIAAQINKEMKIAYDKSIKEFMQDPGTATQTPKGVWIPMEKNIKNIFNSKAGRYNKLTDAHAKIYQGKPEDLFRYISNVTADGSTNYNMNAITFSAKYNETAVHKIDNLFDEGVIRRDFARRVEPLIKTIDEWRLNPTEDVGKQILRQANVEYKQTIRNYFDYTNRRLEQMDVGTFGERLYKKGADPIETFAETIRQGNQSRRLYGRNVLGTAEGDIAKTQKWTKKKWNKLTPEQQQAEKLKYQNAFQDLKDEIGRAREFSTIEDAYLSIRNMQDGLKGKQLRFTLDGKDVEDLYDVFTSKDWQSLSRELIRQYKSTFGKIDKLDDAVNEMDAFVHISPSMIGRNSTPRTLHKTDAMSGGVVFKDLETQFGMQAARIGTGELRAQRTAAGEVASPFVKTRTFGEAEDTTGTLLKKEFLKFYGAPIEDMTKEMTLIDFIDRAGFVVGRSETTSAPIRLYHTGHFDLTTEQIDWLESYYKIFDEGAQYMLENGVNFADNFAFSTENYMHHAVQGAIRAGNEFDTLADSVLTRTPAAIGDTAPLKQRVWTDSVTYGFESGGTQYFNDPAKIAEAFVKAVHTQVNHTTTANKLLALGIKKTDILKEQFIDKVTSDERLLRGLKNFTKLAATETTRSTRYKADQLIKDITGDSTTAKFLKREDRDLYDSIRKMYQSSDIPLEQAGRERAIAQEIWKDQGLRERFSVVTENAEKSLAMKKAALQDKERVLMEGTILQEGDLKTLPFTNMPYDKEVLRHRAVRNWNSRKGGQAVKVLEDNLYDEELAKKIESTLGIGDRSAFDNFAEATGSLGDKIRLIQTGIDAGTPFLQGLPTLFSNPVLWGRATGNMFKVMFGKPGVGGDVARREFYTNPINAAAHKRMNRRGVLMKGAGTDYFRALEDVSAKRTLVKRGFEENSKTVKYATILESGVKRFQAGFEDLGERLRTSLWLQHEEQIVSKLKEGISARHGTRNPLTGKLEATNAYDAYMAGGAVTDKVVAKQLDELSTYVNQMTGAFSHTQAMISTRQANFERAFLLFSPAYTRASLGLVGSVTSGDIKGDLAHKALRNMLAAGVTMHVGMAYAQSEYKDQPIDQFLHLDPSKSDFLTVDIKGVKVGYASFWNSGAKLLGQIASDPAFRGDVLDSPLLMTGAGRGQAGFQEQRIRDAVSNNPAVRWLRGRAAPMGSQFWNLGMGASPLGEEFSPLSADHWALMGDSLMPFWANAAYEAGQENGVSSVGPAALPEFFGFRTYTMPDWEKRDEIQDNFAIKAHNKLWRDLNDVEKRDIEAVYGADPNWKRLEELTLKIRDRRQTVGGGELDDSINQYNTMQDNIRNAYTEEMAGIVNYVKNNEIVDPNTGEKFIASPAEFIQAEKRVRSERNARLEMLKDETIHPEFAPVIKYYESFDSFDDGEKPEDYFTEQYADIYFDPQWEHFNYFDYEGRDAELSALVSSWKGNGEELESYAQNSLFGAKRSEHPLTNEYYLGVNKYFDLYYKGSIDAVLQDKYGGMFNEIHTRWKMSSPSQQQDILDSNANFKKALDEIGRVRTEMRKINTELDAFLYRFRVGGITKLMHPHNSGRKEELNQLEAMEAYIPPWRVAGQ